MSSTVGDWFLLAQQELLLFTSCFFLLGAIDELLMDVGYLFLFATGRIGRKKVEETSLLARPLQGRCAVFIPAWLEDRVIGTTIDNILKVWPQDDLLLFVGCYPNDPETIFAARQAAAADPRVRVVVHTENGPTCKADCLNRIYRALEMEEVESGSTVRMVILHDAEDLVDSAALSLLDEALCKAEFIQLPVLAMPHPLSPWISGHYSDEFAEAHGKTMVVRAALSGSVPGAGVGCAINREVLRALANTRDGTGPFATGALTEDYELGLTITAFGARTQFLRMRTESGRLIATRAYFPTTIDAAVRQKTRWIHGIALQSWDRLGWRWSLVEMWMRARDRRGPLVALLLFLGYFLVVSFAFELILRWFGLLAPRSLPPALIVLLNANLIALMWRVLWRAIFTGREHGIRQAIIGIPRIIVSNTISIIAARRAVSAYVKSLHGAQPIWDKTEHFDHPGATLVLPR